MSETLHLDHPTILVVDDEALLRLNAIDILEGQGFTTLEAANAEEALEILACHHNVKVLFTDVQMPGPVDGLHLASLVHKRWPNVSLLVTSGAQKLNDSNVPDDGKFIAKPYQEKDLIDKIALLVKQH